MAFDWVDIPLAVSEGRSRSSFASAAQLDNLMVVPNPPGSPRPFTIQNTPAITNALGVAVSTKLVRGMIAHGDYVWFLHNTTLYYWDGVNAATAIGTIAGSALVRMCEAGPNKIFIVCPYDTSDNAFVATTSAITAVAPPAGRFIDCAFQDGFVACPRLGTNEVYLSDLDDPTTFGALQFTTIDAVSDRVIGIVSVNRELICFGEKHIEFLYNAGASPFPFVRSSPGVEEVGCLSGSSVAKYNGAAYFLGRDRRIYRLQGYRAVPISAEWIEGQLPTTITEHGARGSVYVDKGQPFYCLSVFGNSTSYAYDIDNGLWHTRSGHFYADIVNFTITTGSQPGSGRVYAAASMAAFGVDADVFRLRTDVFRDASLTGNPTRTLVCPPFDGRGRRVFEAEVELVIENAVGGVARFDYSDGNVVSYVSHGAATVSALGNRNLDEGRVRWARCGSFHRRIHRFVIGANARVAIEGVRARLEVAA